MVAKRTPFNEAWKLIEFWEDRAAESIAFIGKVLDPIIENALKKGGMDHAGDDSEGDTLLSHLVKLTDGNHRIHLFF